MKRAADFVAGFLPKNPRLRPKHLLLKTNGAVAAKVAMLPLTFRMSVLPVESEPADKFAALLPPTSPHSHLARAPAAR